MMNELLKGYTVTPEQLEKAQRDAERLPEHSGLKRCVYVARTYYGDRVGVRYCNESLAPGTLEHYDHGAGIHRNQDALILKVI